MSAVADRTVFAPVAASRPYLVMKTTLLLLGFDLWLTRASHGGRYGAGGFNVAHFELLERLQPPVSPSVYVGLCVLTGALSVALAIASRPPRWLLGLLCALYTWSWSMSMLDSYQHHYLFTLVLLTFAFFPKLTAEDALAPPPRFETVEAKARGKDKKGKKGKKRKTRERVRAAPRLLDPFRTASAWGYALLSWSTALVYGYTAFAKSDPAWLSGAALARVIGLPVGGAPRPGAEDPIGPFRTLLATVGIEGPDFWWAMGHGVVLVQMICCAGYLLAPFRDLTQSRLLRAFYWVALGTALSFHAGAEYMDLKIGWFSWYMIGYALLFFLPGSWITVAARAAVPLVGTRFGPEVMAIRVTASVVAILVGAATSTWLVTSIGVALFLVTPVRLLAKLHWTEERPDTVEGIALGSAALGALALVGVGYWVDLPGAPAGAIVGAVLLGAGVVGLFLLRGRARRIHAYGVGALVAAAGLFVSILASEVRWDFYRNMGGDHRRRGEYVTAYVAYVKANRYRPPDDDRFEKERELRELLERRGELPEVE
jgi:hypothetical protein